jgi:hypothetical protein
MDEEEGAKFENGNSKIGVKIERKLETRPPPGYPENREVKP